MYVCSFARVRFPAPPPMYLPINNTYHFLAYSAGGGDNPRGAPTPSGADDAGAGVGLAAPATVLPLPIGSGDCTITYDRPSSDSGERMPPRRKRGIVRGLRRSAGGCGGSGSNVVLLGSQRGTCVGPALLRLMSLLLSLPVLGSSARSGLQLPQYPCLSPCLC
jgi:hypothetical protein